MKAIYVDKHIPRMLLVKALKPLWPGVVFSRLSPARFAELPDPALPGPRWLRVRNLLCGICASDLHLLHVDAHPGIAPAALPGNQRFFLGHEVVSEVVEVGPDVTRLRVGDRVIMDTRFQGATCLSQELAALCRHCRAGDYMLCENASLEVGPRGAGGGWGDAYTAHESEVYGVPPELDDEAAMMMEPLAVGVRTVLRRPPQANDKALVVGCGPIGLAVIAALRALAPAGCHITAMARYPQQVEMARRLGADEVITDGDGYQECARVTEGQLYEQRFNFFKKLNFSNRTLLGGFEVVYDCVGTARTLRDSLRWARGGGAVVLAGVSLKPMSLDLTPVWYQEIDLIGLYAHGMEQWQGQRLRTYDLTLRLLLAGKLPIDGLITHRFSLAAWRQAIATAQDKRSGAIKVVFDYRSDAP